MQYCILKIQGTSQPLQPFLGGGDLSYHRISKLDCRTHDWMLYRPEVQNIFFFLSSPSNVAIISAKFQKFLVRVLHLSLKKAYDLRFNQSFYLKNVNIFLICYIIDGLWRVQHTLFPYHQNIFCQIFFREIFSVIQDDRIYHFLHLWLQHPNNIHKVFITG